MKRNLWMCKTYDKKHQMVHKCGKYIYGTVKHLIKKLLYGTYFGIKLLLQNQFFNNRLVYLKCAPENLCHWCLLTPSCPGPQKEGWYICNVTQDMGRHCMMTGSSLFSFVWLTVHKPKELVFFRISIIFRSIVFVIATEGNTNNIENGTLFISLKWFNLKANVLCATR